MEPEERAQFMLANMGFPPHCDSYVLHQPKECEYCDARPEWQALRFAWGIAFTGYSGQLRGKGNFSRDLPVLPCPADLTRPPGSPSDHRRWGGNTATSQRGDPAMPRQSTSSVMLYGDQGGRASWPLRERLWERLVRHPLEVLRMHRRGWRKHGMFWTLKNSKHGT